MYVLHGSPKNRSFRVLWMLEELGVEYEINSIRGATDEARSVNPTGKVPALVDTGEAEGNPITDSAAIIQYLADRNGKLTFAAGTLERGLQDSRLHFVIDDIDQILWVNAKHDFVFPEELRVGAVRQACEYDFAKSMTALEAIMGDGPYLMGETFTVPDIILGHCYGWAKGAGFDWVKDGAAADFGKRIMDRPAWQRANEIRANS